MILRFFYFTVIKGADATNVTKWYVHSVPPSPTDYLTGMQLKARECAINATPSILKLIQLIYEIELAQK